jgi:hypothetical protein
VSLLPAFGPGRYFGTLTPWPHILSRVIPRPARSRSEMACPQRHLKALGRTPCPWCPWASRTRLPPRPTPRDHMSSNGAMRQILAPGFNWCRGLQRSPLW